MRVFLLEGPDPGAHRGIVPEEDRAGKPGNPRIRLEVLGLLDGRSITTLAVLQIEMEDSLSLVSLRHDLEKTVFSLPYKDSILVVDLVRIPGGNDESFLGKIGDKNAFASQDEAVVLQRKGGEVELGMGTEFEPVCWVIEVAHYQFISLMNHEVGSFM